LFCLNPSSAFATSKSLKPQKSFDVCDISNATLTCVDSKSCIPRAKTTPTPKPQIAANAYNIEDVIKQPASPSASLSAETLFTMVNQYRASLNLPPFEKDEQLCQLAAARGPELYHEIYEGGGMH